MNSERSKSKDLANKLYQTQAELNMMRTQGPSTPLVPICLNFETNSPAYKKLTSNTLSQLQSFHKQVQYFMNALNHNVIMIFIVL